MQLYPYVPPQVMMAPMEGVIDPVMRKIFDQIGGYDLFVTEFIRVTDKTLPPKVFYRYAPELKNEGRMNSGTPVFVQLLGSQPEALLENAQVALSLGALGIDFNFGCPAKTVNRHDGGASLLKSPDRIFKILSYVRQFLPKEVPVTAKIRLGFDDKSQCIDIAQAVEASKCQHLTVHARTKKEGYKPPAHWEYLMQIKSAVNIPVIANGDIWNLEDYKKCVEISGCQHVALGRGGFAFPHLASQVKNYLQGHPIPELTWEKLLQFWLPLFIQESILFKDDHYALTRTKQWTKFLSRNYPQSQVFFEQIKRFKELSDLPHNMISIATNN